MAKTFERLGIRYAIVGSVASSFYGEARLTNDIDVVAEVTEANVAQLLAAFPIDEYYLSDVAIRQAIRTRSQFNIIHPESGLKVDVIVPEVAEPAQLTRRRKVRPTGEDFDAYFAAPEEVILKKMLFFQEGGSDKHLRDIAGMLMVSDTDIDRGYIQKHSAALGLEEIWKQIIDRLK